MDIIHAFHSKEEIRRRYGQFEDILKAMEEQEGGIEKFALGHKTFGPQVDLVDYLLSRKIFLVKFALIPDFRRWHHYLVGMGPSCSVRRIYNSLANPVVLL